jgi:hypothetical protein
VTITAPGTGTGSEELTGGRVEVRPSSAAFWRSVGPAVAVGFVIRLAFALMDRVPSVDETAYLGSGLNLFAGEGFTRGGSPELHFPPLIPTILGGVAQLVPDPHTAAVLVTLVAGTALLVPVAGLARAAAGDRAGRYAAWVAAVGYGLSVELSRGGGGSEAVYALLVLSALWLAVSIRPGAGPNLRRAAGAGLLCGAAYLARPEGLWITCIVGVIASSGAAGGWQALRAGTRVQRRHALAAGARVGLVLGLCASVFVVPYVWYLHDVTGGWGFTAKTQDASLEAWRAVAEGDRRSRDVVLYGLAENGIEFSAGRYPLSQLVREDPVGYLGIVGVNVSKLFQTVFWWRVMPTPLVLLALWAWWRERRNRVVWSMVAVAAAPVLTVLAFFVLARYLVVTTAVLHVLCGIGLAALPPRWRRPALVGALCLMAVTVVGSASGPGGFGHPREGVEQRLIGEWIRDHTDEDARIMTRSQVVAFYADRETLALPYATPRRTVAFGRHFAADYLVADEFILWEWRPQLRHLFGDGPWPGLELVHEVRAQGRVARVFALDPPDVDPPADVDLPRLAHVGDGSPTRPKD